MSTRVRWLARTVQTWDDLAPEGFPLRIATPPGSVGFCVLFDSEAEARAWGGGEPIRIETAAASGSAPTMHQAGEKPPQGQGG